MESDKENSQLDDPSRHDATRRDTSRHTLTIRQAATLFSTLGVPRSPRSVQQFCELGNVDAIRVKGEKTERYFIDPVSVERYAEELRQLENISQLGTEVSRHVATQRDMTRHDATATEAPVIPEPAPEPDQETVQLRQRVGTLEKENFQLQIDRTAKEQVIGHMVDERRDWIEQLTSQGREIGRLEMQVRQLEAPKPDVSRHDATDIAEIVAAPIDERGRGVVDVVPEANAPSSPEKRRSWWRR